MERLPRAWALKPDDHLLRLRTNEEVAAQLLNQKGLLWRVWPHAVDVKGSACCKATQRAQNFPAGLFHGVGVQSVAGRHGEDVLWRGREVARHLP